MNRMQKIAVYNLVVSSVALLLTIISVTTFYCLFGWPRASAGLGTLGLTGFIGLSPFIFKKDPGAITCDERDRLINRTAALAGFVCSYLYFCVACIVPFFLYGPKGQIEAQWLAWLPFGGFFAVVIVHAVVLLVLYGRGGDDE